MDYRTAFFDQLKKPCKVCFLNFAKLLSVLFKFCVVTSNKISCKTNIMHGGNVVSVCNCDQLIKNLHGNADNSITNNAVYGGQLDVVSGHSPLSL